MHGKHHSEEAKRKMSEAKKGKPTWNKGKHWKLVDGKRVYLSQSGKVVLVLVVTK